MPLGGDRVEELLLRCQGGRRIDISHCARQEKQPQGPQRMNLSALSESLFESLFESYESAVRSSLWRDVVVKPLQLGLLKGTKERGAVLPFGWDFAQGRSLFWLRLGLPL